MTGEDNVRREVKVALQVRVRPGSYQESCITKKHIKNGRGPIWGAEEEGSIILEAILIKVGDAEDNTTSYLPSLRS